MTHLKNIVLSTVAIIAINGCGDTSITYGDSTVSIIGDTAVTNPTNPTDPTNPDVPTAPETEIEVIGDITTDTTWTADKAWIMNGRITVTNGATLTIEPGTYIAGKNGESYLLIDKGAKIMADGTAEKPIRFSSVEGLHATDTTLGKWGGVTLIGNANMSDTPLAYEVDESFVAGTGNATDSSGILRHVKILNSATQVDIDKETNGLSMVGVGSGTVVEDITVDYSDDDGIEIWGGTVNMTNVTISHCTDDHLDVDSQYVGTVKNLVINASMGYAGIEMSGLDTVLTVDGFTITVDGFAVIDSAEGGIFFKKSGVGGKFKNGTIIYRSTGAGAIYSQLDNKLSNISFENVGIYTDAGNTFVNRTDDTTDSADEIEAIFATGTNGNDDECVIPGTTLTGEIAGCNVLTRSQSWVINSLAYTAAGASVRIQDGTTVGGNDPSSYMLIDKNSKIFALGTENTPITFTDKENTAGQEGLWGGLTLIGNANMSATPLAYEVDESFVAGTGNATDSSGILRHVKVLNSATEVDIDKETNGLSMVGVGSGTVVEDITVDYSDDDGIEIWGGTVNMTNVTISHCTDDHLDVDSMYVGTVKNLLINASMGYAGIEMSGTDTVLTLDGFTINHDGYGEGVGEFEGGIYFKKAGVGGKFYNGTINYNGVDGAAIYSAKIPNLANIDFENVTINTTAGHDFEDQTDDATDGAAEIKAIFVSDPSNVINYL